MLRAKIKLIPIPDGWMKVYSLNMVKKGKNEISVRYDGIIDAEQEVADAIFKKTSLDSNNIMVFKDKLGIRSQERVENTIHTMIYDVSTMHWFTIKDGGEIVFWMTNADTTQKRDALIFKNVDGEIFFTISSIPE